MDYSLKVLDLSRKKHKRKNVLATDSFRPETFTANVSDALQEDELNKDDNIVPETRRKSRKEAKTIADEEDHDDEKFASQLIDAALPADMLIDPVEGEEQAKKKKRKERTRKAEEMQNDEVGESQAVDPEKEEKLLSVPDDDEKAIKKEKRKKQRLAEEEIIADSVVKEEHEPVATSKRDKKISGQGITAATPLTSSETDSVETESSKFETKEIPAKPERKLKFSMKSSATKSPTSNGGGGYVDPAIQYLRTWKSARSSWSFQKVRQVWLLRNWRDRLKMSDDDFLILLDYVVDLKGGSRAKTLEEAKSVRDEYEASETYGADDELKQKLYARAGNIVDVLGD